MFYRKKANISGRNALPNKIDIEKFPKNENNKMKTESGSNSIYLLKLISNDENINKLHSYSSNNTGNISTGEGRISPQLKSLLHNKTRNYNIKRINRNNDAIDVLYPLREQSRTSNTANNMEPSKFSDEYLFDDRNNNYDLSNRDIRSDTGQTFKSHKFPTNQSNMKTFDNVKQIDISSISRGQSPIYIDDSDLTSITDTPTNKINYKNYPTDYDKNNLNANEIYSRSNWNNYSQIDNQSYSKQHHNDDLSNYNDYYYSINKCENCKKLILQNENAQSEIRKLKTEIEFLKSNNEKFQSEYDQIDYSNKNCINKYENMELQYNKYESETNKYKSENRNVKTKNENLERNDQFLNSKNFKLNSENINLYEDMQIKTENLKSKIKKYKSLSKKNKSKYENMKTNNEELKSNYQSLSLENANLKTENIDLNEGMQIETEKLKSKIKKCKSIVKKNKSKYENMKTRNEVLESNYQSLSLENNKLKSENVDLKIENENLKSTLEKFESEIKEQFDCNNLNNQIIELLNENDKLNSNLKKYRYKYKKLISKTTNKNRENKSENKPIGFANPKGYCFLNCIVQQFYSCRDFRNKLIEYHNSSYITDSTANDDMKIFVSNFCKLMDEVHKRNKGKVRECVSKVQDFFKESSLGDDVLKCFTKILNVVLHVINSKDFLMEDLFCGQVDYTIICTSCKNKLNTSHQKFNSIALPVPKSTQMIPFKDVIKRYLEKSPVETSDMICHCPAGSKYLYSITEYTRMPVYLLIYLNRVSFFENGEKNNTFITCNKILNFPIEESYMKYNLISVIDHSGDNLGGHYYVKSCFETDQWWILNDSFVDLIEKQTAVTNNTIVFLFKRCAN